MDSMTIASTADRELVTTRVINAPRELVWQAWTDPTQIAQWWGPNGFTTTTSEFALEPGGRWRFVMHGPDGRDYPNFVVFDEVDAPTRLRYRHTGESGAPLFFSSTVDFVARGEQTEITLRALFERAGDLQRVVREFSADKGAAETLQRLASFAVALKDAQRDTAVDSDFRVEPRGETEVVLSRTFHAPRELVFEAMSRPEHIAQWWGPRGYQLTSIEMDFRVGGKWRFAQRDTQGNAHVFFGEYLEINPPGRFVQTFEYAPWAGYGSTEALTLEALPDGRTRATVVATFKVREDRDGMVDSGMEWGARQTWDRLEEHAQSLAQ
jgi:uncharacterized protein YndB with AHSA1/START domain